MSILVLEAITPWVMELARQLSAHEQVTALQHCDFRSQKGLGLPRADQQGQLKIRSRIFPPGFAGKFSALFAGNISRGIAAELQTLSRAAASSTPESFAPDNAAPHIVCPYPYAARWVRDIPGEQIVYYNLDDYEQYDPARAAQIRGLEDELLCRAGTVICLSIHQAQKFRKRFPDRAVHIHHLPLGIVDTYLNPAPESPPTPGLVGYVGNLTGRVDWDFVDSVVQLAGDLTFEFVGRAGDETDGWAIKRAQVFARDNVRFLGPVPQSDVPPYYWRSAVNWMPYVTDHPFNMASSPTKIFDAFGSGRPFVASPIPEVACYPDQITSVATPQEAASALRNLAAQHDPAKALDMRDFARQHIWQRRAEQFRALLGPAA